MPSLADAFDVIPSPPGVAPPNYGAARGMMGGPTGILRPPAPNPPPPRLPPINLAAANPQPRPMTLEEMAVGVTYPEIVRLLRQQLGSYWGLSPEDQGRWRGLSMAAPMRELPPRSMPVPNNLGDQNRERARALGLIP